MKLPITLLSAMITLTTWIECSAESNCHLTENSKGKIVKTCKNEIIELDFDYKHLVLQLSEDITQRQIAIMWYTPKDSKMSDERSFLFDYKNMVIYDNQCLGGNFIMSDDDTHTIEFSKFGESDMIRFNEEDYKACRQAFATWKNGKHDR